MASANSATMGDYALLVRRQWPVLVTAVAAFLLLAVAWTLIAPTTYTSKTSVLVTSIGVDTGTSSGSRSSDGINMDTEAQIVTSTDVVQDAAARLGFDGDLRELAQRVSITVPPNTEILEIGYRGDTAAAAQQGAQSFADAYLAKRGAGEQARVESQRAALEARIDDLDERLDAVTQAIATAEDGSASRAYNQAQASSLNDQLGDLGAQLNALDAVTVEPGRIITDASLPDRPSSPNPLVNLVAGAVLGLLAGVGIAVLRQRSDSRIRRPDDVLRQTGVPVLSELPASPGWVHVASVGSPEARAYARLRNVVTASASAGDRVVLVAGVSGPAGSVAANLAATLARTGEEAVLVCGDVDAETEIDLLGDVSRTGLAEVLAGHAAPDAALRHVPGLPELRVLGVGGDPALAADLLQTSNPRSVLAALRDGAAWVVIEAPSTTTGAEAQTLARFSDLAVVVVEADRTTAREVVDARSQFESMRTPVLGAVVLAAPPRERGRGRDIGSAARRSPSATAPAAAWEVAIPEARRPAPAARVGAPRAPGAD